MSGGPGRDEPVGKVPAGDAEQAIAEGLEAESLSGPPPTLEAGPADVVPPPPIEPRRKTPSFARTSTLIVVLTLLSRLVGFLRDAVIADKFGAQGLTDAYNVANSVPSFLSSVLQGGLDSVVVPHVSPYFGRGDMRRGYGLINALAIYAGMAVAVLVLVVTLFAPAVIRILGPGLSPHDVQVGATLARILVWTVAFGVYFYLGAAALVANDRFFYMSAGPVFMSASATIVLLVVRHPPIVLLAIGLFIGFALQFVFVAVPNLRHWRSFPSLHEVSLRDPEVRRMLALAWPALISSSVGQVNTLIDRWFGSRLEPGSITEVVLAARIATVPLGLFGYAISNASYPSLARAYKAGDTDTLKDLWTRDLRVIILLTTAMMAEMVALTQPIASAAYRHGALTPAAAHVIASALVWYALCLVPFGVRTVINRGFFLTGNSRTLSRISVAFVGLNFVGDAIFTPIMKAPGLAFGTMIDQWISIVGTFYILSRILPALPARAAIDAFVRAVAASIPLAVAAYFGDHLLAAAVPVFAAGVVGRFVVVGAGMVAGAVVGLGALRLVRYPGLGSILRGLRRGIGRRLGGPQGR